MLFGKPKKGGYSINPATEGDGKAVEKAVKELKEQGFDARCQAVQGNTMGYVFYEMPAEADVAAALEGLSGVTTEKISGSWLKMVEKVTRE